MYTNIYISKKCKTEKCDKNDWMKSIVSFIKWTVLEKRNMYFTFTYYIAYIYFDLLHTKNILLPWLRLVILVWKDRIQ